MKVKSLKVTVVLLASVFLSGCSFNDEKSMSKLFENEIKNNDVKGLNAILSSQKEVSILFVGDLMFDRYIRQVAEKRGNDFIFEKVTELLKNNDLVVANLEGPITDNESVSAETIPGEKGHLSFTFNGSLAETLAKQNIKLVNIGNNHILNFQKNGLDQTEKYLMESDVEYFGDPRKIENNYLIKEINGIKIGFVSYNQFGEKIEATINNIKSIKDKVDIIVVYTHWGKEYEKTPINNIKNSAHSFVDAGADLIIGSHPHVVQDIEEYKRKKIYYSLGNFIFDQYFNPETQKGIAVEVKINPDNKEMKFRETQLFLERNGQVLSN